MSTIAAGTTTGTALVNTGDTSGQLVLQTNGTTTALTLDTSQNATFVGNVTLNAQGDLRLADADSSNWVALQAPATVASNVTFTLPSADGTNGQILQTNGSGVLSFAAPPGNYTLLTSGTIANGTTNVDIETGFTNATYTDIVIVFSNVKTASGSGYWSSQFKIGGTYNTTSNYAYSKFASGEADSNLTAQANMQMGIHSMSTTVGNDSIFIVKNRFQRVAGSGVITCLMPRSDNANQVGMWWGFLSVAGDIQGVRFFLTSSVVNFGSGSYSVYGFKYA